VSKVSARSAIVAFFRGLVPKFIAHSDPLSVWRLH
jgi:hypothetical protein